MSPRPRNVGSDIRRPPKNLAPSGTAQAYGKNGDEPRVSLGENAEDPQEKRPDEYEKENDHNYNHPRFGMLAGP